MTDQTTRRSFLGAAALIAGASAAVALPASVATAAELAPIQSAATRPTVVLCPTALKAAMVDQELEQRIRAAKRAFQDTLSPAQVRQYIAISDAKVGAENREFFQLVSEIQRHSPELAVAMSLTAAHVLDENLDERGVCCAEVWEPYPVDEV